MGKIVVLHLADGNFEDGVRVILQIREDGNIPSTEITGKLPPCPELEKDYSSWKLAYGSLGGSLRRLDWRLEVIANQLTNSSLIDVQKAMQVLSKRLNTWLNSESFRPVKEKLLHKLNPSEEIRVIIQTEDIRLRRLPWHLWDFFEDYPKAEVAFSATEYEKTEISAFSREQVRILAILGDSAGIDIQKDRELLENLPNAETTFLIEPLRRELDSCLWDDKGWDILFFAGHSSSQGNSETGRIYINRNDSLTMVELKYALRKSIERGLKLAIFNCCDGLGLVRDLEELHIPQVIVMREPVPDRVAQEFLNHFITAFSSGKSLYVSVREARERLHSIEDEFPCASWLPVICQNPAEMPPTWQELGRISTPCPYRGLSAFGEENAPFFFGRETFIEKLGPAVRQKRLVALMGASGCGKSSVVLAGLIPSLRRKGNWLIACFRPQNSPFENLAEALLWGDGESQPAGTSDEINQLAAQLKQTEGGLQEVVERMVRDAGGNKRLLLVADQFEELYILTPEEHRQPFLDCLLKAVKDAACFTLVLTLRADFYGYALSYRPFADALQDAGLNLGPMNQKELEDAISRPAEKRGVQLEQGLAQRLIDDVTERPGYLPLLQFTLTQLWAKQSGGKLTWEAYEKSGGVEQSLGNFAEAEYGKLGEGDRKRAQRIFIQLVQPGEGTEDTRRLARKAEVGEDNWDLVAQLASARLVVTNRNEATGEETVEIVHEALIRGWGRLQNWMRGHRAFRNWQERLRTAMRQWENNDNKEGYLLQSAPLAEAEGWLHKRIENISWQEQVFIQLSLALRYRKIKDRKRMRRRAILGLAGGLVGALMLLGTAGWQWQRAEGQRRLIAHLTQERFVETATFSRDGKYLATASKDGTARVWEIASGLEVVRVNHEAIVSAVAFSPDGKYLATASEDGTARMWEITSGQQVARLPQKTLVTAWQIDTGKDVPRLITNWLEVDR